MEEDDTVEGPTRNAPPRAESQPSKQAALNESERRRIEGIAERHQETLERLGGD